MKKFFTLIAVALVAFSASAQEYEGAKDVVTNGNIAYDKAINDGDFSLYPEDKLVNFVVNEWVDGVKRAVSTARVAVDPDDNRFEPGGKNRTVNYCIKVSSRDTSGDPWDSQFFVTLGSDESQYLKEGDKVQLKMKIKADKAAKASTQAHANSGNYNWYVGIGDINFTTEWKEYASDEITLSSQQAFGQNGDKVGFGTIAINLAELKEANNYYFDDIQLFVNKQVTKEINWQNIYENDGTDLSTLSVKYFKNYTDAAKSVDGAIAVANLDPDKDYWGTYTDNYSNEEVREVKVTNDWDTQFLISLPYELKKGEKVKVSFKYKADVAAQAQVQAHKAIPEPGAIEGKDGYGGTYIGSFGLGDIRFTTEWQPIEKVVSVSTETIQSICFNLEVNNYRAINTYYFDDIVVAVDEDNVPTSINTTKAVKATNAIYNVAGQQLKSLQKGLNIVNGEKVYVK